MQGGPSFPDFCKGIRRFFRKLHKGFSSLDSNRNKDVFLFRCGLIIDIELDPASFCRRIISVLPGIRSIFRFILRGSKIKRRLHRFFRFRLFLRSFPFGFVRNYTVIFLILLRIGIAELYKAKLHSRKLRVYLTYLLLDIRLAYCVATKFPGIQPTADMPCRYTHRKRVSHPLCGRFLFATFRAFSCPAFLSFLPFFIILHVK